MLLSSGFIITLWLPLPVQSRVTNLTWSARLRAGSVFNAIHMICQVFFLIQFCAPFQVFGVGVHQGSLKSVQRKESLLLFPHIQSIKLTQTQACITYFAGCAYYSVE